MISYNIYDIMYDIIYVYTHFSCLAAADPPPEQRAVATDDDHDPDRPMDFDEERDVGDQGPLSDMDMAEDEEMLALLLNSGTCPHALPQQTLNS